MSNSQWSLSYWVRGQDLDQDSIVDVSSDASVRELLRLIVATTPSLSQHDFVSLSIYKVPDDLQIPLGEPMEEPLGALSVSMLGKRLNFRHSLSQVFQTPPPKSNLNLIVDIPPLDVVCWKRGANALEFFAISCSKLGYISTLKHAIKQTHHGFKDVSEAQLLIYKISCADDELQETLNGRKEGELIRGEIQLNECFNDVPFSKRARVVATVYESDRDASKQALSTHRHALKPVDAVGLVRQSFVNGVKRDRPSAIAKPPEFGDRQNKKYAVACARPSHQQDTIPLGLLHPVFDKLEQDCETIEVEQEDNDLIRELAAKMAGYHLNEKMRENLFVDILKEHYAIGLRDDVRMIQKIRMDGCILENGHCCVILEVKNEGSLEEARNQTIAYYLEATRGMAPKYTNSCLPCLLVVVVGPAVAFSGAAWNFRPVISKISLAEFDFHKGEGDKQRRVTRHLVAFRKAVGTLKKYYQELKEPNTSQAPLLLNALEPSNNPPGSETDTQTPPNAPGRSNDPPGSERELRSGLQSESVCEVETAPESEPMANPFQAPSQTDPEPPNAPEASNKPPGNVKSLRSRDIIMPEPSPKSSNKAKSKSEASSRSTSNIRSGFDLKTTTLFPYPTSYERISDGEEIKFKYNGHIDEDRLIFFGTELESQAQICIKFCHTYSEGAHRFMANKGHAPGLRSCTQLVGEFIMVVQDALMGYQTLADAAKSQRPLSQRVYNSMKKTLEEFHEAGYVHGDIRDVNIMVSETDENDFRFIDFDWAGLEGEARYPAYVNTVEITRPKGVKDGTKISKDQDSWMLEQLDPKLL